MSRLPERVEGERVLLRRWLVIDAIPQHQVITESAEHLRPWMAWVAEEPQPLEQRREMLARWEQEWWAGGDVLYGVFRDGRAVGGCGLHRRLGPNALEMGYWIHASFVRQGLATEAARMLTGAAFLVPGISRVEIHHDKANIASSGVPRGLGYELVGEQSDDVTAPADTGIECIWRMRRSQWESRSKPGDRMGSGLASHPDEWPC